MAKKRNRRPGQKPETLPTIDESANEQAPPAEPPEEDDKPGVTTFKKQRAARDVHADAGSIELMIDIPSLTDVSGNVKRRADCRLDNDQARTLKTIWLALDNAKATLKNGKPVDSHVRAVQWILEQCAAERVQNGLDQPEEETADEPDEEPVEA